MDIFSALGMPTPEQMERKKMEGEMLQTRVNNFIDGMSPEDLSTFSMIVARMATEGEEKIYHGTVLGTIETLFRINYPLACRGCGLEHDSGEHDFSSGIDEPDDEPENAGEEDEAPAFEQPTLFEAVDADVPGTPDSNRAANMAAYRLKPSDRFPDVKDGVECVDCGLWYVSLEDRMLKEPDDCHGCHRKAMFG